ncbi:MAG: hypothetical protein WCQ63_01765 [Methanomethylophilus sp.]|nr:hypothetical protein [Methanomethylophilus sp.]
MAMKVTPPDYGDKPKRTIEGVLKIVAAVLAISIVALLCLFFNNYAALVFGAVGLVFGGYAMNLGYRYGGDKSKVCVAIASVGLIFSVIAFMLGFVAVI